MLWMAKWPGPWPVFVDEARGRALRLRRRDRPRRPVPRRHRCDGRHAPPAVVARITERLARGATFMLPTADAAVAAGLLAERFGLPSWQFTLSATDANRHVLRYARQATGRRKVLVIDYCYHGTVDEAYATLDADGRVVERRGTIGAPFRSTRPPSSCRSTTCRRSRRRSPPGDVAAVLIEPALTNIGIVLPEPEWHDAVRAFCDRTDTLLVIDETHTLCAGPRGMTARDGLHRMSWSSARPSRGRAGRRLGDEARSSPTGCARASAGTGGARGHRRRGSRRNARRERGLDGRHAGHPVRGAHPRGLPGDDRARDRVDRRRAGGDRRLRGSLAGHPAGLSGRVQLRATAAARRARGGGRRRLRTAAVPAPARPQPRGPHHAVPQHGADEPGHDCADVDRHTARSAKRSRRSSPDPTRRALPEVCRALPDIE